jgi:methylase of polypeptide subunit release factors
MDKGSMPNDNGNDLTPAFLFRLGPHQIRLSTSPSLFRPNTTTGLLFDAASPFGGMRVLDMGSGIGPIGIGAALSGAESVLAVDIMEKACSLVQFNARSNGVSEIVSTKQSFIFRDLKPETFDLVISDLSGMSDAVARISPWYPATIPTGGGDGTELAVEFLENVQLWLRPGGRVVFPILSLSRFSVIEEVARKIFGSRLTTMDEKLIPMHPLLLPHRALLDAGVKDGSIQYFERGSRLFWKLWLYSGTVIEEPGDL